jgi:hypothetical protein
MLVITRHRVGPDGLAAFLCSAEPALAALAGRPGCRRAVVAQAIDEGGLVVVLRVGDGGAYRRALSSYEVKVDAVPLLRRRSTSPRRSNLCSPTAPTGAGSGAGPRTRCRHRRPAPRERE